MLQSTAEEYGEPAAMEEHEKLFFASRIRQALYGELENMGRVLGISIGGEPLHTIYRTAAIRLFEIERLFCDGHIDPSVRLRLSHADEALPVTDKTVRVGVYPVAADPFHWGHLLIGLSAVARLRLDKVIFVLSGNDPRKPGLTPCRIRHPMGQDVLRCFAPLFCYSSIALDTDCDGETNLFRILKLNPQQKIDAWYIAGADHYRRFYPGTEYPDTIHKIEEAVAFKLHGYDEGMHTVSAAFIERGLHDGIVDSFLNIQFLSALPFKASSTMIREACAGTGDRRALAVLPYTAYVDIRAFSLYSGHTEHILKPAFHTPLVPAKPVCAAEAEYVV